MDLTLSHKILAHPSLSPEDKLELSLLYNAHTTAVKALQNNSTAATLKDYQAAKAALEPVIENLAVKYELIEPTESDHIFKDLMEGLKYLKSIGYKIGKSKLYADKKYIKMEKGGKVKNPVLIYMHKSKI